MFALMIVAPDSPEDTDGDGPVSSSEEEEEDEEDDARSEFSSSQQQQQKPDSESATKSSFQRLQFPRDSGCYDSSSATVNSHHRHYHHKKVFQSSSTLQYHHHRKLCCGYSKCNKDADDGSMLRTHQCSEIPNNLDSSLQHHMLQQCGNSSAGNANGRSAEGDIQHRLVSSKLQSSVTDGSDSDKQSLGLKSSLPQQQNFLPNIPVTSSGMVVSPVSADIAGRGLISASSLTSSPIRTCTADSYVVPRGKLMSMETCRKAGNPSASSPLGSLRNCNGKKQILMDSSSNKCSPSNPFIAMTTNVSPQVASPPQDSGTVIEDASTKLTMVKYVVGGNTDLGLGCESGNMMGIGRGSGGCCLSEKSSDSGVSSSSLSSGNPKDTCGRKEGRVFYANSSGHSVMESPTRNFSSYSNNINNDHRSSPSTNANKELVQQCSDGKSYQ